MENPGGILSMLASPRAKDMPRRSQRAFIRRSSAQISANTACAFPFEWSQDLDAIQDVTPAWEPAFLRQAREFLFFPLLPRQASKWVPIFDRGTGSKPERLRSGFLQADLSLIV